MNTLATAFAGLAAGIPVETVAPLSTVGLGTADLVAALGALVVATLGVLAVRHFQAAGVPPNPAASPDRGEELKRAA
jgi:hypothetical protein